MITKTKSVVSLLGLALMCLKNQLAAATEKPSGLRKMSTSYFPDGEKLIYDVHEMADDISIDLKNMTSVTVDLYVQGIQSLSPMNKTFTVFGASGLGMSSVVHAADLRTVWTFFNNSYIVQCKDFLQFQDDFTIAQPICGKLSTTNVEPYPIRLRGKRSWITKQRSVITSLHLGYYPIQYHYRQLLASVVFTPFSKCSENGSDNSENATYSCFVFGEDLCIPTSLKCNGEINCPHDQLFGIDEKNCSGDPGLEQRYSSNQDLAELGGIHRSGHGHVPHVHLHGRSYDDDSDSSSEEDDDEDFEEIQQILFPTGLILFALWGIMGIFRKCYKCYRYDITNDEFH